MFLDDELLQMCKEADLSVPENVDKLNVALCNKCQDHYKSQISPSSTKEEILAAIEITFNAWDSFVRMALKGDTRMVLIGKLFKKHTFRKQLLDNKEMMRIYSLLKDYH